MFARESREVSTRGYSDRTRHLRRKLSGTRHGLARSGHHDHTRLFGRRHGHAIAECDEFS